jgi:hypothetical protein
VVKIAICCFALGLWAAPAAIAHSEPSRVTLVLLPRGIRVDELAKAGLSPGLLSAGLGSVPANQTYLDVTQGNRVFDSFYDSQLPPLGEDCAAWPAVLSRARSAPAEIVPGLLASTLRRSGVEVRLGPGAPCVFAAPRPTDTAATHAGKRPSGPRGGNFRASLEVRNGSLGGIASSGRGLRGDELLIALSKPPPGKDEQLAIGIAGRGFDGNLTSDSTRTDGYVLSTDLAPTILDAFGIEVPAQMSGEPIRAQAPVDSAAAESLGRRMAEIPGRRGPVIGFGLLAWLVVVGLLSALSRGRLARAAVRVASLAIVYLPLVLLLGAALEPSQGVEQLLTLFGAPLLAAATLALLGGYRALAVASGLTVAAYAIDVIAGSPLTSISLLGPNPGLGVRFYGIGNELEAMLGVLVVAGTGAALSGYLPRLSDRGAAIAFLAVGLPSAFVFAAGRFGADVGAAIVLPLGAAVAAAAVTGGRRRRILLALAVPLLAVALLALIDLISGGDAHLTRSVLDAGGLDQLSEVAQRRLQLSAHSFARPIVYVFLPLILIAVVLAWVWRGSLESWLDGLPAMRAGLVGAVAATVIGTLANDSGALLLEIGTVYLLVFAGFAWAEAGVDSPGRYP